MSDGTGIRKAPDDGECLDKDEIELLAEMATLGADHFHVGPDGSATFSRRWPRPLDII